MSITLLHALIFLVISAIFYNLFLKATREKARFNLFKVRDNLIILVANEKMSETDPIFVHFYKRVNLLLQQTPKVGFDDIIEVLLLKSDPKEFDKNLNQARKKIAQINSDPALKNIEIRTVVKDYYDSVEFLMLTHSSWILVFYYLSKFVKISLSEKLVEFFGRKSGHIAVQSFRLIDDAGREILV